MLYYIFTDNNILGVVETDRLDLLEENIKRTGEDIRIIDQKTFDKSFRWVFEMTNTPIPKAKKLVVHNVVVEQITFAD